jgi:hypothetical protein
MQIRLQHLHPPPREVCLQRLHLIGHPPLTERRQGSRIVGAEVLCRAVPSQSSPTNSRLWSNMPGHRGVSCGSGWPTERGLLAVNRPARPFLLPRRRVWGVRAGAHMKLGPRPRAPPSSAPNVDRSVANRRTAPTLALRPKKFPIPGRHRPVPAMNAGSGVQHPGHVSLPFGLRGRDGKICNDPQTKHGLGRGIWLVLRPDYERRCRQASTSVSAAL